jgi:hypothetical protein
MELNVWEIFSVLSASIILTTFLPLNQINAENNGSLKDAATANMQDGQITQSSMPTILLHVVRKTVNGKETLGILLINGKEIGTTFENNKNIIAEGLYTARVDLSPRLKYRCPHIQVADRDVAAGGDAGIRIHVAKHFYQLKGCIGVSKETFSKMMALLPKNKPFKVLIYNPHS